MARKSWRNHLWLVTCLYFLLGLYNIAFAWLGLIFFVTPLLISIIKGDKAFCNKYCDRGRFFRFLGGNLGLTRGKPMPAWMKSAWFRYLFVAYFFGMFGSILVATWLVAAEAQEVDDAVKLFMALRLPVDWSYSGALLPALTHSDGLLPSLTYSGGLLPPWAVQFAFGFYSLMLTSLVLGLLTMLLFKPRSWCVYCPMGTMTQLICKIKEKES
ncbi:MAG: 4Fe-4S binding protein [Deltaproteobacteria bacterium]|nr:4Fe-4S binding protein [Deltaproteobacteria bacterium]